MECLKRGYVDGRGVARRQIGRVPLQKVGIRVPRGLAGERDVMMGGFFVVR